MGKKFKHSKEKIINEAIDFYNKHQKSPHYNQLSFSRSAVHNFWKSWHDFLVECEIPTNKNKNILNNKEDGLNLLKRIAKEKDRVPITNDLKEYKVYRNWFLENFGSFNQALHEAGIIDIDSLLSRKDLVNRSISELKILSIKLNRMPSVDEYEAHLSTLPNEVYVSRRNLCNNLKMTFVEICTEYLEFENNFGKIGSYYINKKGERCSSLAEFNISNYLIENNISYKREGFYRDIISDFHAKYRYDWILDCGTVVEYFGLYNPSDTKNKIILDYTEKTHEKIRLCQKNNIPLIALYPYDTLEDLKGVKDKLNPYIKQLQEA